MVTLALFFIGSMRERDHLRRMGVWLGSLSWLHLAGLGVYLRRGRIQRPFHRAVIRVGWSEFAPGLDVGWARTMSSNHGT